MQAEIYTTTRDGFYIVTDTNWDGHGSLTVTVRQMIYPRTARTERKARDLARRCLSDAKWTRLDSVFMDEGHCLNYRFTVSRLGREYR